MIPTFQNPSGVALSLERRKAVIELAVRHDVLVIEDDPYSALRFEGDPLPSLRSMDPDGRVIYVGTLSKVLSPGLRIGYVAADHAILAKLNLCKQAADLCSSTLSQRLACVFLDDRAPSPCSMRSATPTTRVAMRSQAPSRPSCRRDRAGRRPRAGSSCGQRCRGVSTPTTCSCAASRARSRSCRGAASPGRTRGARSLRLNFSAVDEDTLREGARRLGAVCGEALELATALAATRSHAPRPA